MCVYMWPTTDSYTGAHQSWTQKQLTLYPHAKWGKTVERELPGPNGGHRDKGKNKAFLLCVPKELMWLGERVEVTATCCQAGGAAFIETRALLGLG